MPSTGRSSWSAQSPGSSPAPRPSIGPALGAAWPGSLSSIRWTGEAPPSSGPSGTSSGPSIPPLSRSSCPGARARPSEASSTSSRCEAYDSRRQRRRGKAPLAPPVPAPIPFRRSSRPPPPAPARSLVEALAVPRRRGPPRGFRRRQGERARPRARGPESGDDSRQAVPVLCGSAFSSASAALLLDAVADYLPEPAEAAQALRPGSVDAEPRSSLATPSRASYSRLSRIPAWADSPGSACARAWPAAGDKVLDAGAGKLSADNARLRHTGRSARGSA